MVFLTGCNGLVGSFIARKLLAENHQIKALKRKDSDLTLVKDIAPRIQWVEGDICEVCSLQDALDQIDIVIHAAAMVSFYPPEKSEMFKVNVEGTANIVNTCILKKVKKFIHVSSIAALGRKKNSLLITENDYWENSSYNSNYAISKYLAEIEVWRGFEEGLKGFIVNPSVILGPGNWNTGSTALFNYTWKERPFYSEGEVNYIDVRDVGEIIFRLMNEEKALGERFILNSGKISYKDLLYKMADCFGKKGPKYKVGKNMSEVAWRLDALRSFLTRKKPIITQETARISGHSFTYDNSKVQKLLGYKFQSLDDTISWTCKQLRQINNV